MRAAVVLLSGGLDSATVLAIAREGGYACSALSVDYGQRHRAELEAAERVARALGALRHETLCLDLARFGGSALTDSSIAVPTGGVPEQGTIPVIPGRCNRKRPIQYDERRYKDRWRVEAMFCRLKDFRRIATRYDKLARNDLPAVHLAAAIAFWL
mgnify:CR=1 FL=1